MSNTIYQSITDNIVRELESGAAPWVKPWKADSTADHNFLSGKAYQGINRLILGMQFRSTNAWATFKQWQERGGNVRKGEKGTHIVWFSPVDKTKQNESGEDETSRYFVLKQYVVFNLDQVDNVDRPLPNDDAAPFDVDDACESRLIKSGASISHGGDAAFFAPGPDRIQLPNKITFDSPAHYYATAFHELTHWTGHESRLDRTFGKRFGDSAYAFEELVAELGAAFLCQDHHISGELRHAGYIQSWLKVLREDNKAIFKAAALAQKAADYILSLDATSDSIAA